MRANCRLSILAGGMLCYRYRTGMGQFCFHSLCEVGEPYQEDFKLLLGRLGRSIEFDRQLVQAPWVADFALKGAP